jgi:NAD+ kinase
VKAPRSLTLFTRRTTAEIAEAVKRVLDVAGEAGVEVKVPDDEVEKHGLEPRDGVVLGADPDGPTDLAVVLGGDGTILSALGRYANRDVPVFAVNFGAIGFLATVERDELEDGLRRAFNAEFEVLSLPALSFTTSGKRWLAVNDVSFHREPGGRVAELGYSVRGEELGQVRCDGLVASTPAGSTGYNLANAGPVMAWGVEGYVVSFIAPHTLTARSLVVNPSDVLEVVNRGEDEKVEVTVDGRPVCWLGPHEQIEVRFEHDQVLIAQAPGASFYNRLREKFGRLAY